MNDRFLPLLVVLCAAACRSDADVPPPVTAEPTDAAATATDGPAPVPRPEAGLTEPFECVVTAAGDVVVVFVDAPADLLDEQVVRVTRRVHSGFRAVLRPLRRAGIRRMADGRVVRTSEIDGEPGQFPCSLRPFPQDRTNDPPLEAGEHVVVAPLFPVPGSEDLPAPQGVTDVAPRALR